MRKNFMIMLLIAVVILIVASISAYALLMPSYKSIELNGYSFEVPENDVNVSKVNDNYMTYDDSKNNITIKSYAINNVNETNYNGSYEIGKQLGSNAGVNVTIENKTVMNQSGKYTYYTMDTYQMIIITSENYDTMSHMLKTMNVTQIKPNQNTTLNITNLNNTTDENKTTTKTTTKKTKTSKKSSDDDISYINKASEDEEIYDVVIPGSGGQTTKAKRLGLTEYGNRYEEVGTGKIIYS